MNDVIVYVISFKIYRNIINFALNVGTAWMSDLTLKWVRLARNRKNLGLF